MKNITQRRKTVNSRQQKFMLKKSVLNPMLRAIHHAPFSHSQPQMAYNVPAVTDGLGR
jgi:hypothetical protein